MALMIRDGDYVSDGASGLCRVQGQEELLQRVLFRLCARRGGLPFLENLGSRLWQLGQLPVSGRQAAAKQYVTEALAEEADLSVESVTLMETGDGAALHAELAVQGERLPVTVKLQL